jgi:hypothetical protein
VRKINPSRFIVVFDDGSGVPGHSWVSAADIVHIEPRPLKVGDRVRTDLSGDGDILAIDGNDAWLRMGACRATFPLSDLTRVAGGAE